MHESNLTSVQPASHHVGRVANVVEQHINLIALRMAPPTAADRLAGDLLRKIRNCALGGFEHGAVTFDEIERFFFRFDRHVIPVPDYMP